MRERILLVINELGLTQKKFAEQVGITAGGLTDFIKGRSRDLSSSTVARIFTCFNVNPVWLLTGTGEMFVAPSSEAGPAQVKAKKGKGDSESLSAVRSFEQISSTAWYGKLSGDQKEIIAGLSVIRDKDILNRIAGIITMQVSREKTGAELDRELEELGGSGAGKRKK